MSCQDMKTMLFRVMGYLPLRNPLRYIVRLQSDVSPENHSKVIFIVGEAGSVFPRTSLSRCFSSSIIMTWLSLIFIALYNSSLVHRFPFSTGSLPRRSCESPGRFLLSCSTTLTSRSGVPSVAGLSMPSVLPLKA